MGRVFVLVLPMLLACASAQAGERLLVPELPGWKTLDSVADRSAEVTEMIPGLEDSRTWTRRLSVHAFRGSPMTAGQFLAGLEPRSGEVCDSILAEPVKPQRLAGAEAGRRVVSCGRYKGDGKGSYALYLAVRGREALYVVARSWRGNPFRPGQPPVAVTELDDWNAYLDGVRLCDTNDLSRPCPKQP
jgi:hypothetical protein